MKAAKPRLWLVPNQHSRQHWESFLRAEFPIVAQPEEAEYLVVIGGDGAMLHGIHQYAALDLPFLGLHAGTRGFLLNQVEKGKLPDLFAAMHTEDLWLLEALVHTTSGEHPVFGFNDIWVERVGSQTLKMRVTIDGVQQAPLIVGDGMLFSTPQGSTGYNWSLRGKVLMPGVPVVQMTPIACVVNKAPLSSVLLSEDCQIELDFDEQKKRPARLFHDGIQMEKGKVQSLSVRKSDRRVRLAFSDQYAFKSRVFAWQFHS